MIHLTPRTACAIEAAAIINPTLRVFVYFIDVRGYAGDIAPLISTLTQYNNIQIASSTLEDLAHNSSIESWIKGGAFRESKFLVAHTADIARLLVLDRYAGLYMDLDIIALNSFDKLGRNFAVKEDLFTLTNAFLHLGSDPVGRETARRLLAEIPKVWNPEMWAAQGPQLITRVFRELCDTKFVTFMTEKRCHGLKHISEDEILPIGFYQRHVFFDDDQLETGKKMLNDANAVAVHLWASRTRNTLVHKTSPNLLNYLGRTHCPKIFETIKDFW